MCRGRAAPSYRVCGSCESWAPDIQHLPDISSGFDPGQLLNLHNLEHGLEDHLDARGRTRISGGHAMPAPDDTLPVTKSRRSSDTLTRTEVY